MQQEPYHHKVTRHHAPDGKRCKASDPGAIKSTTETRTYYGDLPPIPPATDADRVSLGTTDLGDAWGRLKELRKQRAREIEGIRDPILGAARKPLAEHVEDWLAEVASSGVGAKWVGMLRARVLALAGLAGWARITDIDGPSAAKALADLATTKRRNIPSKHKGPGVQTRNHYLTHLRQFVTWCLDEDRIQRDPIRRLSRLPVEGEERHARRPPTDVEVGKLLAYLHGPAAKIRRRMSGPCRALGYLVAMATGYRAGELRSLRRRSFDLDAGTVALGGKEAKNRRRGAQPLPPWLVADLRAWLANPDNGLWSEFPENWPGQVLLADQVAAGIQSVVEAQDGTELHFDFHSLRHWYCSWASNAPGVSPKVLLELSRHSDPTLTLQRYAKARDGEAAKVVDTMPRPGSAVGFPVGPTSRTEPAAGDDGRKTQEGQGNG